MTRPSDATQRAWIHDRTIAAHLHHTTTRMTCPALVAMGSDLHSRTFKAEYGTLPVWATYRLDRSASPNHCLQFGDGSRVPLLADDLQDVLLLTHPSDPALQEVFA